MFHSARPNKIEVMTPTLALALVAAYVVGSIDFAVVVARMHGVDIHEVGSGNPGASNVLRSIGRLPAAMVLLGDTMKGVVGSAMGFAVGGAAEWAFLGGLMAVIGHCYPVFHRFKGGRGVATTFGVLLFNVPVIGAAALAAWWILAKVTQIASISSLIVIGLSIPLAIWRGVSDLSLVWLVTIVVLVVWRHRGNIYRVFTGSEQKVQA